MAVGCGKAPEGYYYMVASLGEESENFMVIKDDAFQKATQTLTIARRFEKKAWCEGEAGDFARRGYKSECTFQNLAYEPAFLGKPMGKWFALQYFGSMPPTAIFYDSNPPMPDNVAFEQLKATVPHVLKFAALHQIPAAVRIFSPTAEIDRLDPKAVARLADAKGPDLVREMNAMMMPAEKTEKEKS